MITSLYASCILCFPGFHRNQPPSIMTSSKEGEPVRRYIGIILLALIACCQIGYSLDTYIGPYHVIFNDTAHPVYMVSLEPVYLTNYKGDYAAVYVGNNKSAGIRIVELYSRDDDIANYPLLNYTQGFVEIDRLDRIIDSYPAISSKYKNITNNLVMYKASFKFNAPRSGYYTPTPNFVEIYGWNYTDFEFDRLLDTFQIRKASDWR